MGSSRIPMVLRVPPWNSGLFPKRRGSPGDESESPVPHFTCFFTRRSVRDSGGFYFWSLVEGGYFVVVSLLVLRLRDSGRSPS